MHDNLNCLIIIQIFNNYTDLKHPNYPIFYINVLKISINRIFFIHQFNNLKNEINK